MVSKALYLESIVIGRQMDRYYWYSICRLIGRCLTEQFVPLSLCQFAGIKRLNKCDRKAWGNGYRTVGVRHRQIFHIQMLGGVTVSLDVNFSGRRRSEVGHSLYDPRMFRYLAILFSTIQAPDRWSIVTAWAGNWWTPTHGGFPPGVQVCLTLIAAFDWKTNVSSA